MHKVKPICPACKQNGKKSLLELRKINLSDAVYICEDRRCIYPIGFQWQYVKIDIFDEESDCSENSFDMNTNHKSQIESSNYFGSTQNVSNTSKLCNEMCQKDKNLTTGICIKNEQTDKIKANAANIISNVVIEETEDLMSTINMHDYVKTDKILSNPIKKINKKCIAKTSKSNIGIIDKKLNLIDTSQYFNVHKKINKPTTQNSDLPESVVKKALALSEYFSNNKDISEKPRKKVKSVFDIMHQSIDVKVEKDFKPCLNLTKSQNSMKEVKGLKINTTSIEDSNCFGKGNNLKKTNDNFIDTVLTNEDQKVTNEFAVAFDDLLFNSTDKYDTKKELDFSEMDELLSFLPENE